jgi:hypothetical protein
LVAVVLPTCPVSCQSLAFCKHSLQQYTRLCLQTQHSPMHPSRVYQQHVGHADRSCAAMRLDCQAGVPMQGAMSLFECKWLPRNLFTCQTKHIQACLMMHSQACPMLQLCITSVARAVASQR